MSTNQNHMFYNFMEQSPFENIGSSNEERNTSFFNNNHTNTSYFNDDPYVQFEYNAKSNEFVHKNDPNFTKPESSFAFGTYDENENEQNDCFDGVDENPQPFLHKLKNFMTFKPDIPETPLYKSKPLISTHYKKDSEVKIGNTFDNKEALDLAVRLKAIQEGYQFVSQRTDPNRYERKCYHFKECAWSIHAKRWGNTDLFQIIRMNDVHTCPKTQTYPNHRNANKKVIAHILNPKLQDNRRVLKGKDIQHDILLEYKTSISYQQAWRGKDYGLDQIRGSPYESFEMLPYYCYNLERKNQGSVTRIKTDDKGVFEMLFIALGASIRTFLNYLRPLLIIDAAHLKGTYKGTNLVAVGMDGNNQIVPVAFGICKGETGPCWSWWMSVLKECIGDHSNLLFISDRHPAIALAVHNEFPLSYHAVCCRHLMMNLSLKKKTTKGLFWKICKTYTPDEFTANMNIMQVVQPDAYHKLCQAGTQRWSRAHCPLVRYNYMTSNSVESVNACSVINRKLPVLMLAETYRAMLQEWYFERQKLTANMKYEITDWAAHKVHKRKLKSATWIVHGVNQYVYQVLDGRYNRQVNLETGVCECRKWQLSEIPCGHVIAVTRFLRLTDCVQYVSDWFKKDKYQGTYAESIHFLGDMQEWEFPSHIHPAIPPRMDNPQPGRPKNTNRIKSQGEEPRSIHCSRCKQDGHKRDNCKISIVNEPRVNDQPAFYHQNQSYDHNFQSYNQYPSQPYGDVTYQGQPYYHNQYPTHPSQMNEQYDSQQYGTQHLDDLNNNCSNKVDGYNVTSWRMLFVIPSTNVVKLIGFTKDDDPIVEVDRGRMLHPLQVYDRASEEFHNVGISADGGSFFIGPYKESLILLNV
ncbi:transposase, MuDR, MULE transposase domain protein [Tanacetum coccineum]